MCDAVLVTLRQKWGGADNIFGMVVSNFLQRPPTATDLGLIVIGFFSLATVKQPPMDATIGFFRTIAPSVGSIVALKAYNMLVTTEVFWTIHADTLNGDGELSHLPQIHCVSHLHKKLHGIKEFAQDEPYIRSLSCAILFYHRLDFFH